MNNTRIVKRVLFVALYFVITRKVEVVFCTGGPTSSHLVGSIIGKLTKARVINEFQDPLVGAKINSSNYKMKMTIYLEKFFIKNSIKTYFVTEKASKDAQNRYSDIKHKIDFKYPGAWNFNLKRQRLNNENRVFEFLHLGTLYGSRNLDNIFKALDELYEDNDTFSLHVDQSTTNKSVYKVKRNSEQNETSNKNALIQSAFGL